MYIYIYTCIYICVSLTYIATKMCCSRRVPHTVCNPSRLGVWLPRYSTQQVFYSVLLLDRSLFSECFTMFLSTISVSLELFAAISEWFVCLQYESHIMCTIE